MFLTVSFCLVGGGLFNMALSLFELPSAINPHAGPEPPGSDSRSGTSGPESREFASADEVWEREPSSASRAGEHVSGQGEPLAGRSASSPGHDAVTREGQGFGGMLDLNSATQAELEELPGIGPALAERIVSHRVREGGFKRVEDLLDVSGIGEKTLSRFRAYVYVSRTGR